jgi:hypothetical protein
LYRQLRILLHIFYQIGEESSTPSNLTTRLLLLAHHIDFFLLVGAANTIRVYYEGSDAIVVDGNDVLGLWMFFVEVEEGCESELLRLSVESDSLRHILI